jgi:hypothetical protein
LFLFDNLRLVAWGLGALGALGAHEAPQIVFCKPQVLNRMLARKQKAKLTKNINARIIDIIGSFMYSRVVNKSRRLF